MSNIIFIKLIATNSAVFELDPFSNNILAINNNKGIEKRPKVKYNNIIFESIPGILGINNNIINELVPKIR